MHSNVDRPDSSNQMSLWNNSQALAPSGLVTGFCPSQRFVLDPAKDCSSFSTPQAFIVLLKVLCSISRKSE